MSAIITVLPGWAIVILLWVLLTAASMFGARMRDRWQFGRETSYAVSAAVSLLVLLIGFTFSLALNRYDNRRALVVEEAAAIFAVWERLPLETTATRAAMAPLLQTYAGQRRDYFTFGVDLENQVRADEAADATMGKLWAIAHGLAGNAERAVFTRMMMDNLGRIDDAAWRREDMARATIPFLVIDLLVVFSLLTAISMGIVGPAGKRPHPTHLLFFALNAAAILLVLDLDRPRSGLVLVSQRPMIELQAIMADDMVAWKAEQASTTVGQ
jgi:hypothetical protein